MKKLNVLYWIFTSLIAAMMLFSSIPDILCTPEAVDIMHTQLGYPIYFIPFIGVAKLLGGIALLVPRFPRLKEWAYAGIAFDLIGAMYSAIGAGDKTGGWLFILLPLGLLAASYVFHHKRLKAKAAPTA